jgi:hypothetical protein
MRLKLDGIAWAFQLGELENDIHIGSDSGFGSHGEGSDGFAFRSDGGVIPSSQPMEQGLGRRICIATKNRGHFRTVEQIVSV